VEIFTTTHVRLVHDKVNLAIGGDAENVRGTLDVLGITMPVRKMRDMFYAQPNDSHGVVGGALLEPRANDENDDGKRFL
jgi:hypothetical protein